MSKAAAAKLVCAASGYKIALGQLLKEGGEGKIYETDHPSGLIAKIYHAMSAPQVKKLSVMLANTPHDPALTLHGQTAIAWPADLLYDSAKKCVGFVMPRIKECESLFTACNPEQRARQLPYFTWLSQHRAARDMALLVQSLHAQGYVVGDINPKNFLVHSNEKSPFLVAVIDTDSFQVHDPASGQVYLCQVQFPGYTPPELLRKDSPFHKIGEAQDRFGLAVLIYALLCSHHPFEGKWTRSGHPPDTNSLVQQGFWVYAGNGPIQPLPVTIPLSALHPQVAQAFQRCFNDGHRNPAARPTAQEWCDVLNTAIDSLAWCGIQEPRHYYEPGYKECCWCQLKNQEYEGGANADPFASPQEARNDALNKLREFEQALMNQDERRLVALWYEHPFIAHHPPFRKHQKQVEELAPTLRLLDQFILRYRQNAADERSLCQFWQNNPRLAQCRAAQFEKLDNLPIAYLVQTMQRRLDILGKLEQAIGYPKSADDLLHEEGEKNIVSTYQLYQGAIVAGPQVFAAALTRVEQAKKRLEAWQQLQVAMQQQLEDAIVAAWEKSGGLLEHFAPAQPLLPKWKEMRKKIACLEIFINLAQNPDCDEERLWNLWSCDNLLSDCRLAQMANSRLGGMSPAARAELARARIEAMQKLHCAMLAQEQHGNATGLIGEAEEHELVEVERRFSAVLKDCAAFRKKGKERVEEAQKRLKGWELLQKGLAERDEMTIAEAWGDGRLFARFAPARPCAAQAEQAARQIRTLREFMACWQKNNDDEEGLAAIWQKEPTLAQCSVARHPQAQMKGLVPCERAALASKRLAILQALRGVVTATTFDDFALLRQWDDSVCRGHPAFHSFVPLLYKARERASKYQLLVDAIQRDDDAGICAAWDDNVLTGMAQVAPLMERIRLARRRHQLSQLAVRSLALPGLRRHGDSLQVCWDWGNIRLTLCSLAARRDRFPLTPTDIECAHHGLTITRELYDLQHGATLDIAPPAYVCVWPALFFAGQVLVAENPLQLLETVRRRVRYRLLLARWRPAGVRFIADTDLRLPPLIVVGVHGRLPVWNDSEAAVSAQLPEISLVQGKPQTIVLPRPARPGSNLQWRLFPQRPEDAAWLDLQWQV